MIKKLVLPLAAAALFIVAVGIFMQKSGTWNPKVSPTPIPKPQVVIGENIIDVEVAKTNEDRELGLGGRNSLDPNSGMLFVFTESEYSPKFWMKDMLIPIDIIWIKDGKIIKIDRNAPAPKEGTADSKLTVYSAGTVNYVLEVNAGFCNTNKISVGDEVTISGI